MTPESAIPQSPPPAETFGRRVLAVFSDVFVLAAVIGAIVWASWYFGYYRPMQTRQVIRLNFTDANELTPGAMVRMMGVEVGHVSKIRLVGNHVEVIVKTRPGTATIPSGSRFDIQFTGLAGSKAIEIRPPNSPQPYVDDKPEYLAVDSVRLKQLNQLQIDVARDLKRQAQNFSDFFGKRKSVEALQENVREAKTGIDHANVFLNDFNGQIVDADRRFGQGLRETADSVENFAETAREGAKVITPARVSSPLHYFRMAVIESAATLIGFRAEQRFLQINNAVVNADTGILGLRHGDPAQAAIKPLIDSEQQLARTDALLGNTVAWLETNSLGLQNVRTTIQGWNRSLTGINAAVEKRMQKKKP